MNELDLNQAQLSNELGISKQNINGYIKGRRPLSHLAQLAFYYYFKNKFIIQYLDKIKNN